MANQVQWIEPENIGWAAEQSKVFRGRCYCGWYHFYGLCGHFIQRLKCGRKRTRSGQSGFCDAPKAAPQYNVAGYYVNAYCNHCMGGQ